MPAIYAGRRAAPARAAALTTEDEVRFTDRPAVPRRIVGFHQDEEGHWVADLDCGHGQHLRHEPPMQSRPWVHDANGRAARVGTELWCVRCVDEAPAESAP